MSVGQAPIDLAATVTYLSVCQLICLSVSLHVCLSTVSAVPRRASVWIAAAVCLSVCQIVSLDVCVVVVVVVVSD